VRLKLLSLLAILFFLAGVLWQLFLSGGILWAEVEAGVYGSQINAGGLNLNCPLVLSPSESGTVTATITNRLDEPAAPLITAEVSSAGGMQRLGTPLALAPHETRIVQWPVNDSDLVFGRLILVNVIQGRYGDLDPGHGYCGILVFNLFHLNGIHSLVAIMIGSIVLVSAGGILWRLIHAPFDEPANQTFKACEGLAGVTTLALLTALPRWWGLTLPLDAFALIMLSVIFTEFLLFPKSDKS